MKKIDWDLYCKIMIVVAAVFLIIFMYTTTKAIERLDKKVESYKLINSMIYEDLERTYEFQNQYDLN